ncbi:nitronate monooxygenase [bacterium]|nr:nitronate monooxygenase [bacterium]
MSKLDDFRLMLGSKEYVPLVIGGMGVDISSAELALEAARLGGIGHISDALSASVSDRRFKTAFLREKAERYRDHREMEHKRDVAFDLEEVRKATLRHVGGTMEAKRGPGAVFVNVMEKLTMNAPKATLKTRLEASMDAGVDGITLSAGLHLGSLELVAEHPRFRDVHFGIIVSSVRALALFLKRAKRVDRMPDYVVVEGPLAGGHLGFGLDEWPKANLKDIVAEVIAFLAKEGLSIPVIPAGGIFTGTDAVAYLQQGAAAVQVATRFTITRECGLPDSAKQIYLKAEEADVEVNTQSPTGYPMRMLKNSPAIGSNIKPNCETLGYLLDSEGRCSYLDAYNATPVDEATGRKQPVRERTCLCTHMNTFKVYTCGHYVYRLKETTVLEAPGRYHLPSAEHVFKDYQFSEEHRIALPKLEGLALPL